MLGCVLEGRRLIFGAVRWLRQIRQELLAHQFLYILFLVLTDLLKIDA